MIRWMAPALALMVVAGIGWADAAGDDQKRKGELTFEVFKDARQEYRWRLKAANGRLIAMSDEGYSSKAACREGIRIIQEGAAKAKVEEMPDKAE
ncbi:MAG TPA: DUF1508 domain-containing protein [Planctomycetota bacterium]|nr:DUF1508 domain-containing protein [Planctomycetota bacterium]